VSTGAAGALGGVSGLGITEVATGRHRTRGPARGGGEGVMVRFI
jgi:hypothetical protein